MIQDYAIIFGHYRDAVVVISDGVIIYANAAATRAVGAEENMAASQIFPETFLEFDCDKYSCALNLGGVGYSASAAKTGNCCIVTLYAVESGDIHHRLMNTIGSKLKERVAEIKMASGILTPYIENIGDEKMMRYNRIINKDGYILSRLVGNMTYLEGADSTVFEPAYFDLNLMAENIVGSVAALSGGSAPKVKCVPSKENIILYGDKQKLELALLQLLSNSLKNTPPDGIVTLNVGKVKGCAVLEVVDTGCGIREDELGNIWNPDRYDKLTAKSGAGTGLAIVQSIARLHEGMAILASTPQNGTRVSMMLPIKRDGENALRRSGTKYDSGLENIMVQLADVIPFEHFSDKFMD